MKRRIQRVKEFKCFFNETKNIFESYAQDDCSSKRLNSLFSLCICPGGRYSGMNEKEIEVFYGNRVIGQTTQIGKNLKTTTKLETAHGATLAYHRTDDGHVICNLYPAASENQRPPEQLILLDKI